MDAPPIQYAKTADGVSIAYYAIGEGPPLVYLNPLAHLQLGWLRSDEREWYQRLAQGRRLIRLDTRGLGLSQTQASAISMEGLTADLDAVADRLGIQCFDILSSTWLDRFAIHYAVHRPARVSKLIIWGAARAGAAGPRPEATFAVGDLDAQLWYELVARDQLAAEGDSLPGAVAYLKEIVTPEVRRAYTGGPTGVRDLLPQVLCPTLIIFPRLNPMMPLEAARQNAASIPNCQLVLYEGQYNIPHAGGDFDIKLRIINDFLGPAQEPSEQVARAEAGAVRTILFTDLADHTAMMQRLGDARGREILREHERITRETLAQNGGTEVKAMGDGFMASFGSAQKALECAIALQRAFASATLSPGPSLRQAQDAAPIKERGDEPGSDSGSPSPSHGRGGQGERVALHIGINAGEPIAEDDDLFGSSVILAARAAAKATAGQVLVTNVVRELVAGKGFVFTDAGEFEMRGFEDPVRLYELRW